MRYKKGAIRHEFSGHFSARLSLPVQMLNTQPTSNFIMLKNNGLCVTLRAVPILYPITNWQRMAKRPANTATTKGQRCTLDVPGLGLIDGRTREARMYGLTVLDFAEDLGGQDRLSRAQLELARRAAGLSVLAALAESRLLAGDDIDIAELVSIGNAQRRILATLGLQRLAKDVPDLGTWLRDRAERGEAA